MTVDPDALLYVVLLGIGCAGIAGVIIWGITAVIYWEPTRKSQRKEDGDETRLANK